VEKPPPLPVEDGPIVLTVSPIRRAANGQLYCTIVDTLGKVTLYDDFAKAQCGKTKRRH
jgi:hypothetical protein